MDVVCAVWRRYAGMPLRQLTFGKPHTDYNNGTGCLEFGLDTRSAVRTH